MRIYILRHGQTDLNVERRLQGRLDVPLNETGIRQAEQLRDLVQERGLTFDRIYSSPLDRALRTGEIVTGKPRSGFIIDSRLAEMDFGELEGEKYMELPGEKKFFFTDPEHFQPMQGHESMTDLVMRMKAFFEDLVTERELLRTGQNEGDNEGTCENILLLSHGTSIHAMLVYLRGKKMADFWDEDVHNCDLLVVDYVEGENGPLQTVPGRFVVRDERIGIVSSWNYFSPVGQK